MLHNILTHIEDKEVQNDTSFHNYLKDISNIIR